eukprot:Gb_35207 [translate_table: standard]
MLDFLYPGSSSITLMHILLPDTPSTRGDHYSLCLPFLPFRPAKMCPATLFIFAVLIFIHTAF